MKRYIPLYKDVIFTMIFNDERYLDILTNLVALCLDVGYDDIKDSIELMSRIPTIETLKEARSEVDVMAKINGKWVDIEINTKFNEGIIARNVNYISKRYKRRT